MWNCDQTTRIISDQVIHRGLGMSGPLLAAIVKLAASRQCFLLTYTNMVRSIPPRSPESNRGLPCPASFPFI